MSQGFRVGSHKYNTQEIDQIIYNYQQDKKSKLFFGDNK